jgi:hypothetical protein
METKSGNLEGIPKSTGEATETEPKAPESTSKPKDPAPATEDVPDPDEDDLDDLDGNFLTYMPRAMLM